MKDPRPASLPHAQPLLCLLLAACAASPRPEAPVPEPLQAFVEAATFLLPGHQSYAFLRMPKIDDTGKQVGFELRAMCGSDFQSPKGIGAGSFRGVTVRESLDLRGGEQDSAAEQVTIGGMPVRHTPERSDDSRYSPESWSARVDGRFAVGCNRREEIELALERRTRIRDLLAPFADMPPLPLDTQSVIYLHARLQNMNLFGAPYATERIRIAVGADRRVRVWHRLPLRGFLDMVLDYESLDSPQVATTEENGWKVTTTVNPVEAMIIPLFLIHSFGLEIFI